MVGARSRFAGLGPTVLLVFSMDSLDLAVADVALGVAFAALFLRPPLFGRRLAERLLVERQRSVEILCLCDLSLVIAERWLVVDDAANGDAHREVVSRVENVCMPNLVDWPGRGDAPTVCDSQYEESPVLQESFLDVLIGHVGVPTKVDCKKLEPPAHDEAGWVDGCSCNHF